MRQGANLFILLLSVGQAWAQQAATANLKGRVLDAAEKKPVIAAAVVIPEIRKKVRTDEDGNFSIAVPLNTPLTVIINGSGLKPIQKKINLAADTSQTFILPTLKVKSATIAVKVDRYKPKISQRSLTNEELKEVPATFGDSLSALSALPGIIRTGGFLGPLIIRGAP